LCPWTGILEATRATGKGNRNQHKAGKVFHTQLPFDRPPKGSVTSREYPTSPFLPRSAANSNLPKIEDDPAFPGTSRGRDE
jgi:hypothetical protein